MANLSNINNVLRVSTNLRVGINTDAASYALEIGGTNSGIKLKNSAADGKVYSLLSDTSGNFQIYDDAATSGRLVISSGGDATFAGTISSKDISIKQADDSGFDGGLTIERSANTQKVHIGMDGGAVNFNSPGGLSYKFRNNGTEKFTVNGSGNATFAGNVGVSGKTPTFGLTLAQGSGAGNKIAWTDVTPTFAASIYANNTNDKLTFATKNASNAETVALEIDTSQNATFAGNVGIGDSAHGTASLTLKNTSQHIRFENNGEFAFVSVLSTGELDIFGHGTDETINFRTGTGSGTIAMSVVGSNVGIGTDNPIAKLHVYQNDTAVDTTAGITIEQDGTGDSALSFLLTATKRWRLGIDNNDSDKFKISDSTNLAASNRLTIDTSGNVGIGTTSPSAPLEVAAGNGRIVCSQIITGTAFMLTNNGYATFGSTSSSVPIAFSIDGDSSTPEMAIDTSGNVAIRNGKLSIGQSSENNIAYTTGETWIGSNGLRYNSGSDTFARTSASSQAAMMVLTTTADVEFYTQPSTSDTGTYPLNPKMVIKGDGKVGIGTDSPAQSLDTTGKIRVRDGGNTTIPSIQMGASGVDGLSTPSTNDIAFITNSTEKMRIRSGGNFHVGTGAGTLLSGGKIVSSFDGTINNGMLVENRATGTASQNMIVFTRNASEVGSIASTNTTTTYVTSSSDKRLKKNINVWEENVLDKFKNIKPKQFHFNNQNDLEEKTKGYIAQNEVDKFPEAYPLKYHEESKEDRYQFNPSGMTVYLMKAIQELEARIKKLENN